VRRAPSSARRITDDFIELYYRRRKQTWSGNTYWLGVPVKKLPLDLWVMQELIVETRPTLIVETGAYSGGSALFFASILDQLRRGRVITIDRSLQGLHRRAVAHRRVRAVAGDSVADGVVAQMRRAARGQRVMVFLDSNHRSEHVERELDAYGPLVSKGCYLVVEDTSVNGHPLLPDFGPGPMEALRRWLRRNPDFEVDRTREKFLATLNPGGYVRRARRHGR
jgi:cephalosporin hydroxylase